MKNIFLSFFVIFIFLVGSCTESKDEFAPQNHIDIKDIKVYSDKVVINEPNLKIGESKHTGSMLPIVSKNFATYILKKPETLSDVEVGDIIAYINPKWEATHRVIRIDYDDKGVYFTTKGDNSYFEDGVKVRFEEILFVIVGIIY